MADTRQGAEEPVSGHLYLIRHIVNELALPPVKIHCSVLAEDAIKAAIADYKKKQEEGGVDVGAPAAHAQPSA